MLVERGFKGSLVCCSGMIFAWTGDSVIKWDINCMDVAIAWSSLMVAGDYEAHVVST